MIGERERERERERIRVSGKGWSMSICWRERKIERIYGSGVLSNFRRKRVVGLMLGEVDMRERDEERDKYYGKFGGGCFYYA